MAKKAAPKTEKVNTTEMFAEFIKLNGQKKVIEKRLEVIKEFCKSALPEGGQLNDPTGKFLLEVGITTTERVCPKDVLFTVVGEKAARKQGLIVEGKQTNVSITEVVSLKEALKK